MVEMRQKRPILQDFAGFERVRYRGDESKEEMLQLAEKNHEV